MVGGCCVQSSSDGRTRRGRSDSARSRKAALKERSWTRARTYFSELLESYPQSPLRADAKLGVGDTFLGENNSASYVYAQNEYREFLAFYPTNPRADYAQMQLGMVHFNQMLSPQRDQTETREAIKEFQTFVDRYPNSPLINQVKQRLREAKDRLSDADMLVANFYLSIRLLLRGRAALPPRAGNGPRIHPQGLPLLPPGGNPRKDQQEGRSAARITSAS